MAMQAIAAFWTRAKSVAHADSPASNPFLNPNAPAAAATAAGASADQAASSSDATAAAAPSAKNSRLPNPGKFENYNQEARLALSGPNAYDGAKFNVAKVFQSQHKMFSVSNNIHLGSTESQEPATFDLDIMYQDQSFGAIMTKYLPSMGAMQGQVHTATGGCEVQAQFQLMPAPNPTSGALTVHVPGRAGSGSQTSLTATTGASFTAAFMQSLTRSLAAGVQFDHSWKEGKSSFSGGMRYQPVKGHVFSAGFVPIQAGIQLGQLAYARTFQTSPTEAVTMSTAFQATSTGETTCNAALDMQLNESTLQLIVDNRLGAQWSYTERLAGDLFSLTLNGSMSSSEQAYKFGFGITCNL